MRARTEWRTGGRLADGVAGANQFVATVGTHKLEIGVTAWGDGHLKINGLEVATITGRKTRRQAFHDLQRIAEHYPVLDC